MPTTQTVKSVQTITRVAIVSVTDSNKKPTLSWGPISASRTSTSSCGLKSKVIAVGAGVNVQLGTLLAMVSAGLFFVEKKQQRLQRELDETRSGRHDRLADLDEKNSIGGQGSSSWSPVKAQSKLLAEMNGDRA